MMHALAGRMTDALFQHCRLDSRKRGVYQYGCELFLSTSFSALFIVLVSCFAGFVLEPLVFLSVFISLRIFVGGFHASTYGRCFVLSSFVYWSVIIANLAIYKYLEYSIHTPLMLVFTVISVCTVFVYAPVRNRNHPLSEKMYAQNKVRSRKMICFYGILAFLLFFIPYCREIAMLISTTLLTVSIMMVIPLYSERRQ